MTRSFFHPQHNLMTKEKLEQIKRAYASLMVEGMDMDILIEYAEDSLVDNMKGYELEDLREEIVDYGGEELWDDLFAS